MTVAASTRGLGPGTWVLLLGYVCAALVLLQQRHVRPAGPVPEADPYEAMAGACSSDFDMQHQQLQAVLLTSAVQTSLPGCALTRAAACCSSGSAIRLCPGGAFLHHRGWLYTEELPHPVSAAAAAAPPPYPPAAAGGRYSSSDAVMEHEQPCPAPLQHHHNQQQQA
jgi:hypothetical protein